jgi:alpha-beta hydrolase superfamily lysophospholipase
LVWTFAAPAFLAPTSPSSTTAPDDRNLADNDKHRASAPPSSASSLSSTPVVVVNTMPTPTHKVFGVEREIDIPPELFPTEPELDQLNGPSVLPACQKHGWYESVYKKAKLHYRYFVPPEKKEPRAVIIYAHGIATHGGKAMVLPSSGRKINASLLAESCLANEIALYLPDMYGHGYSEGTRFWIPEKYENNLADLRRFVSEVVVKEHQHSKVPIFLMGESYGGCLSILLAKEYQDNPQNNAPSNFAGLLLPGPAIMADLPPYPVYFVLKNVLAPLFPKWRPFFMPNTLPPERIWSDPEVVKVRADPGSPQMRIDGSGVAFRLGTAANLVRALHDCQARAIPGLVAPFCVVHGVQDLGVPVRGSDYLWETAATPDHAKAYLRKDEGKHDMLADPHAEEAMDFMMQFLLKQIRES